MKIALAVQVIVSRFKVVVSPDKILYNGKKTDTGSSFTHGEELPVPKPERGETP